MSWEQLQVILDQRRRDYAADRAEPPVACPNDGTPLVESRGILFCTFDGYQWPRDGRPY